MGFKRPVRLTTLKFEDDYEGLEIVTRAPTVREALDMQRLMADATDENPEPVFTTVAQFIVSWNLEDEDGNAVPVSSEGLMELDLPLVGTIVETFLTSTYEVPVPLDNSSDDSKQFLAGSIPMETL